MKIAQSVEDGFIVGTGACEEQNHGKHGDLPKTCARGRNDRKTSFALSGSASSCSVVPMMPRMLDITMSCVRSTPCTADRHYNV